MVAWQPVGILIFNQPSKINNKKFSSNTVLGSEWRSSVPGCPVFAIEPRLDRLPPAHQTGHKQRNQSQTETHIVGLLVQAHASPRAILDNWERRPFRSRFRSRYGLC